MPSGHSTSVCAASFAIYLSQGISNLFIFSLIFASFIMYDARAIRHQASKHAILLNKLSKNSNLDESLGHTTIEVLIGAIIGIIIASIVFLF